MSKSSLNDLSTEELDMLEAEYPCSTDDYASKVDRLVAEVRRLRLHMACCWLIQPEPEVHRCEGVDRLQRELTEAQQATEDEKRWTHDLAGQVRYLREWRAAAEAQLAELRAKR